MTIIVMNNVPGEPLMRQLWEPLDCPMMDGTIWIIPRRFKWDGSSSSYTPKGRTKLGRFFQWVVAAPINLVTQGIFPRHRHPVASCKHDWRCHFARSSEERKWADKEYEKDIGKTSWWITKKIGYIGVRTGAALGIGVNY